jgi:hypothetical protein
MERRAYDPTGTYLAVSHVVHGGVTGLAEALIESFGGGFEFRSAPGLPIPMVSLENRRRPALKL